MDTKLDKNVSTTTKESKTEFSETSCSSSNVTEDESNLEYLASYNERSAENAFIRVANLPLVHSTVEILQNYYDEIKNNYPRVAPCFKVAEDIAHFAVKTSKPVVRSKYGESLNNYVNNHLDHLENKIPILNQPAKKVIGKVLCYTDDIVEYYLPKHTQAEQREKKCSRDENNDQSEQTEPCEKINDISEKLKKRTYEEALRKWNLITENTKGLLNKLKISLNLIQWSKKTPATAEAPPACHESLKVVRSFYFN